MSTIKELKDQVNNWDNEDEVMIVTSDEMEFMNENTFTVLFSDNDIYVIVYHG